jgi:protein-S-isoprenylcysteine O-methyltransferase Ste14
MADRAVSKRVMAAVILSSTVIFTAVTVLAWGPWQEFFSHPALLGTVIVSFLSAVVVCFSDVDFSSGRREDMENRWILPWFFLYGVLIAWLPPYADRRDILTIDGDPVRYIGLLVYSAGAVLRIAPVFILGRRFSALVAIQEHHELVTDGLYGVIRHPSYLGAALLILGWMLIFRSGLGLLLLPIAAWLGVVRIKAEEALLASEFGASWENYRRRTWRVLPLVW